MKITKEIVRLNFKFNENLSAYIYDLSRKCKLINFDASKSKRLVRRRNLWR